MTALKHTAWGAITLIAMMLLLVQCTKDEVATVKESPSSVKDDFAISASEAMEVAQRHALGTNDSVDMKARRSATLTDVRQEVIIDSIDNKPLFYIINAANGFTIVSADMRTMPILAYSKDQNFSLNDVPPGVSLWMESAKKKIRDVRQKDEPVHSIVAKEWRKYLSDQNGRINDTNCIEWYQYGQFQCQGKFNTFGPLLTTQWGQQKLSTAALSPTKDCDGCGRVLAGCGPVAMAQIEEFYHPTARPRQSDFTCTPNTPDQMSLAILMQQMGFYAWSVYKYAFSCNTFTSPANVRSGLKAFGFSNGGSDDDAYNYEKIKIDLSGQHPVIFWGSTCLACFSDYHIWVGDGLQENNYSEFNCATKTCTEWSYSYMHMNWGWDGYYDGWYSFGAYNPGGNNYNANLHVITGIRP